jgi:hypothetical protein
MPLVMVLTQAMLAVVVIHCHLVTLYPIANQLPIAA